MKNLNTGFLASILVLLLSAIVVAEKPHIVFLINEDEYNTKETLPEFAKEILEPAGYQCSFIQGSESDPNRFENIELLDKADLLFISVRRKTPPVDQMKKIKAYCESGKPIIGIRTASHAFSLREGMPPEGHAHWPEFDAEVLGGNYQMHYGNKKEDDPKTFIWVEIRPVTHPIVEGLKKGEFQSPNWLYKNHPISKAATPLVWGRVEGHKPNEPVAWTHHYKGANVFYTSLGLPEELKDKFLQTMLVNAIDWALTDKPADQETTSEKATD